MNAADLPFYLENNLEKMKFDRVEVANIIDRLYLGIERTLGTCGSLLKPLAENPYATLITLFMNANHDAEKALGKDYFKKSLASRLRKAMDFAPPKSLLYSRTSAAFLRASRAKGIFSDFDHLFAHYMRMENFEKASRDTGMRMKAGNTIIDEWPLRLRKEYGEPGAQEAFDRLMASASLGYERYVEWARSG